MKHTGRNQRILILSLLGISVLSPVIFLYARIGRLTPSSDGTLGFVEDIPGITYHSDVFRLNSLKQEGGEGLKEPVREVLKDNVLIEPLAGGNRSAGSVSIKGEDDGGVVGDSSESYGLRINRDEEGVSPHQNVSTASRRMVNRGANGRSTQPMATNAKISSMRDQLIMARAYLQFTPPNSNSRLVRELKLRIKETKSILSQANKDSDLSRSALQKMRAMEASLSKAGRAYPDCPAMATKLRAMAYNSEEQLRAQSEQVSYLVRLSARTISKGLHCLSMQLTSRYFGLRPEQRELPKKSRTRRADLYHVVIFSDNILACSVVIKSAVSSSADPSKLVFHVVTDSLNFPAMTMWFLMNPPRAASVHVASSEDFDWLPVDFGSQLRRPAGVNPRLVSPLNHLRFYLPQIFPFLGKVLLLDHDVVVRKDLGPLWRVDLKGKVNGAVETCGGGGGGPSLRLESFVDLSDPALAGGFDPKSCAWAFGMNVFDLDQWRLRELTKVYQKWLQLAVERPSWKAGTLPLGLLTFYNHTRPLGRRWHLLGLGRGPDGATRADVERAAVIHYDGSLKPWLEMAVPRYRAYWARFVDYGHPLLRQCNIHE